MLSSRQKDNKLQYIDIVQDAGITDYVQNGMLHKSAPVRSVLVESESDLALLTDYEPGTIAYTAGYTSIWQKSTTDTWESI